MSKSKDEIRAELERMTQAYQGGDLVGKVSLAQSGSESRARQKRAQFRVIE
ncbi:hypothetical protein [Pseudomonas paracarnis]|jgi:hypothetical protein|uniref:hypothetical protein n=1 Tax=Pseudomonas paracarnis TaxID=2750625 RepID=UPI001C6F7175|nr:hypothetical protein [Pseudomonas paracarnis]MBW9247279.1 hypothetical protein [Pseudomonas paracarnis]MBW9247488.1 hypothetical protein [Pseudomonas paracarnis]